MFLPSAWFTPVLPPTEESTWDMTVVGTWGRAHNPSGRGGKEGGSQGLGGGENAGGGGEIVENTPLGGRPLQALGHDRGEHLGTLTIGREGREQREALCCAVLG